jgi:DNA-binding transcriptional MerR regulator
LDRQDVLQIFNISLRTLQNWRAKGLLKHFKIGGKIYYRLKDVEEATHLNERPFREEKG